MPVTNITSTRRTLPTADWSTIGPQGHGVQFCADDTFLIRQLTTYVGTTLIRGDAAVVLATKAHHDGLATSLRARGFHIELAQAQGRYVPVDAAELLSHLLVADRLDSARFTDRVGSLIQRAAAAADSDRQRVAVFGELVGLVATKQPQLAIELEDLWNDLRHVAAFSLCCAYPMKAFSSVENSAHFLKVCAQHSHVFPVDPSRGSYAPQLA